MSNPINVHEIAAPLIALYDGEAKYYAAAKADEMPAAGNLYESRTWRRIQEAVDQAQDRDLLGDFCGLVPWADPVANDDEAQPPKTLLPKKLLS